MLDNAGNRESNEQTEDFDMKSKELGFTPQSTLVVALAALGMLAIGIAERPRSHSAGRSRRPESFSGLIND